MKRFLTLLLVLLGGFFYVQAQTTRVRGSVTDAVTGEPIPFVSVYFEGTTIGISTDLNGRYSIETRSADAHVLSASLIGYYTQSFRIVNGSFTELNFRLEPDINQLEAAYVKPDNRYIKSILHKIDKARDGNNPDRQEDWKTSIYSKIEIDATNMEAVVNSNFVQKNAGIVINNYADTSAITGKPFIPIMISENSSTLYHSQSPYFKREVMNAARISGLSDDSILRQYTGGYLFQTNFYESSIDIYDLQIPNPAASTSQMFYNYFLVDSLNVEGRKTYVLRFHPKKLVTSPTIDGEMHIDADDFGIRSVHAALSPQSNVNWVRHINMDIDNRRTESGKWFYMEEKLFLDLSITLSDSSTVASFMVNRSLNYDSPEYGPITDERALKGRNAVIEEENPPARDETYWDSVRPYALTDREKGIYRMVEDIKELPAFKAGYGTVRTLAGGYLEVKKLKFEFGRWARTFSYTDAEGFRMQLGGRTTKDFSKKIRLSGYMAYGIKDKSPKGEFMTEFMFNRQSTSKLTLQVKRDYEIFSSGTGVFSAPNMFSAIFAKDHASMQNMTAFFTARYEHEFNPSINTFIQWQSRRIWGNDVVPLIRPDGTNDNLTGVAFHELTGHIRLSYKEIVNRNYFYKSYLQTKYPVLDISVSKGFKGISANDFDYWKLAASIGWSIPSGAAGFGYLSLNAGMILGNIPYMMLKLHEGNQTYFLDKTAFSCMKYYEFMSDRWISGFYEHNFNGFFLGKIPLIKKLELREIFTVRYAWGTMTDNARYNSPYKFLHNTNTLEVPYVEVGVGIGNILRLFRIDAFWRLTNKRPDPRENFAINVGFGLEF